MSTIEVNKIDSVVLQVIKTLPQILLITANGENENNNYTNIRLVAIIYKNPPPDGIWEFRMVGDVPVFTDHIHTNVQAGYEWKDFPSSVLGIRVKGFLNSRTEMII
jgi:hypothetical protein